MTLGICELLWMKQVPKDSKIQCERPIKLFCDNKSAIGIAHNHVRQARQIILRFSDIS